MIHVEKLFTTMRQLIYIYVFSYLYGSHQTVWHCGPVLNHSWAEVCFFLFQGWKMDDTVLQVTSLDRVSNCEQCANP